MINRGRDPIHNLLFRMRGGAFDMSGNVNEEVVCRACGYNLFKMPETGRCPECGAPVGASAMGDLLQNSRPEWLEHLARWTQATAWANSAMIGLVLLLMFNITRPVGAIATTVVFGFWALALWNSVAPEPAQQGLTRPQLLARGASVAAIALVMFGFCSAIVISFPRDLLIGIAFAGWAAHVVGSSAQLRTLSPLMYRALSTELAWLLGARAYYLVVWHSAFAVCLLMEFASASTCCLGMAACIGAFWAAVVTASMQFRVVDILQVEESISRQNWRYHEQISPAPSTGPGDKAEKPPQD